jgi:phosphoglycolate phosphatase-like HAD superfamily hydrolase
LPARHRDLSRNQTTPELAVKRLVLFDIDGTLLRCGPQVRPIFLGALSEVFGGHAEPRGFSFAGRTDSSIILDLVRPLGVCDEEIHARMPAVRRLYCERLEQGLEREKMLLLPGVAVLLERLAARTDVVVGLLTGNWREGARIKLSRFDLGRYFRFGAFGDDAVDRRDLVPIALERAASLARRFEPHEALIVGDSLLDVDCARAWGVPALAVATGFTSAEKLAEAGADWVFEDLELAGREHELFAR